MTRGLVRGVAALAMVAAASTATYTQERPPDPVERRKQIHLMEGLLATAGSMAAEGFAGRLHQVDPAINWFIGQSRARGFILEGYGIFFDVEVPELRGSVVLQQFTLQRDLEIGKAVAALKGALEAMPDGPHRRRAMQALGILDFQAGPLMPEPSGRNVGASDDRAVQVGTAPSPAEPATEAPEPDLLQAELTAIIRDPQKEYRDTVQRQLIEVMLDYSAPMEIAPDEWLAVAARVTEAGQRGNILMLRVRGSDLAMLAQDRSRRDEIRQRVEVKVF